MKVLYLGEIVDKNGVFTLKSTLPELRSTYNPDFIIANADSATGGAGLGVQHAVYLRKLGIDCITMGESAYYKIDMTEFYPKCSWVLRPANLPYEDPGRGWKVFQTPAGKIAVITLLGQASFNRVHADNPFKVLDYIIERIQKEPSQEKPAIFVDFHASATAEKLTLAEYADGRISAIVGSHSKALTADARITAKGMAAITDCGRTGSILSVGGMDPDARIYEFMTSVRSFEGGGTQGLEAQGCFIQIGDSGKAERIESFRLPCKERVNERVRDNQEN
ncbi:MAG: YmdB family metallophosphoesterase [Spirochaetaceae bacterium]|nr:YmdB family metallophosphoesterase [Spirochaetaceae bacterium]